MLNALHVYLIVSQGNDQQRNTGIPSWILQIDTLNVFGEIDNVLLNLAGKPLGGGEESTFGFPCCTIVQSHEKGSINILFGI